MAESISPQTKEKVIALWLQGKTRDEIAMIVQISAGSVSNIRTKWQRELDDADYPAVRDLVVQSRKHGMSVREYAEACRFKSFLINKLGAGRRDISSSSSTSCSYENLETILRNIIDTCIDSGLPEEKLSDTILQVFELSNNESFHPVQLPYYLSKKIQEKKQLEQDIEKLGKLKHQVEKDTNEALQKSNITNDTINEHVNVREELERLGIPFSDVQKTINAIKNTSQLGYEPTSIAAKFANSNSLEKMERDLENKCLLLKQKADRYQQIFSLCEKIAQLKINPDQIEFVVKIIIKIAKRDSNNSVTTTTTVQATSRFLNIISKYEIIEELETIAETLTTRISALKKRLEELDNFWAHKQHTIKSLVKLYCKGLRDEHILYIHNFFSRFLDKIGLESLVADLEQYANLKEALEGLSKEADHKRMEISLLQKKKQSIKEKSHIIYLKLIKRKIMMQQLSEKVAKAAAVFNLPSATLSTNTMLAMLSNIIHQKSEEKEKTTAGKIIRYNVDGKAIL